MVDILESSERKQIRGRPDFGGTAEKTRPCRRGRPRRWSAAEKARIVAESRSGTGSIAEVARRHNLHPNQLYTWRQEIQAGDGPIGQSAADCGSSASSADFIPVTVASSVAIAGREPVACSTEAGAVIEVLVGSLTVRLKAEAGLPVLERVLQAAWRLT